MGRSNLFSSSLCGFQLRKTPSPGDGGNGGGVLLAFPQAVGTEGHRRNRRRVEWGNAFLRAVSIPECVGSRSLGELAFFSFSSLLWGIEVLIPSLVLEGREELFRGFLGVCWSLAGSCGREYLPPSGLRGIELSPGDRAHLL